MDFQADQINTTGNNISLATILNSAFSLLIMIIDIQGEDVPEAQFYNEFPGQQLTNSEKEVAGTYFRGETGWTFNLQVKAGCLMYGGVSLLKKIGTDKYQSAEFPDWFYETIRDEKGDITELIMNDISNISRTLKCLRVE